MTKRGDHSQRLIDCADDFAGHLPSMIAGEWRDVAGNSLARLVLIRIEQENVMPRAPCCCTT